MVCLLRSRVDDRHYTASGKGGKKEPEKLLLLMELSTEKNTIGDEGGRGDCAGFKIHKNVRELI